jgi:hypothetical protein
MEWFAAIARRPSTSSTCAGRRAHDAPRRCPLPALGRHGASQLSPVLPRHREMRWSLGPSACSPSCRYSCLSLRRYRSSARRHPFHFMVILIALSIAQFLTLAATVSPSDTHISDLTPLLLVSFHTCILLASSRLLRCQCQLPVRITLKLTTCALIRHSTTIPNDLDCTHTHIDASTVKINIPTFDRPPRTTHDASSRTPT